MLESVEDTNPNANVPYSLLISKILIESQDNISVLQGFEDSATYDCQTFASMVSRP